MAPGPAHRPQPLREHVVVREAAEADAEEAQPRRVAEVPRDPEEAGLRELLDLAVRVEVAGDHDRPLRRGGVRGEGPQLLLARAARDGQRRRQVQRVDADALPPADDHGRDGRAAQARDPGAVGQHELPRLLERPGREDRAAEVPLVLRVDPAREVDRVHPERLRDPLRARGVHLLEGQDVRVAEGLGLAEHLDRAVDLDRVRDVEADDAEGPRRERLAAAVPRAGRRRAARRVEVVDRRRAAEAGGREREGRGQPAQAHALAAPDLAREAGLAEAVRVGRRLLPGLSRLVLRGARGRGRGLGRGAGASAAAFARAARAFSSSFPRQHCLYFFPDPQWQGSLRPRLGSTCRLRALTLPRDPGRRQRKSRAVPRALRISCPAPQPLRTEPPGRPRRRLANPHSISSLVSRWIEVAQDLPEDGSMAKGTSRLRALQQAVEHRERELAILADDLGRASTARRTCRPSWTRPSTRS